MKGLASRKLAVEVLTKVEVDKAYANLALSSAFKRQALPERDRAFVTALVQGVLRHREELDEQIALCSSQPINKMVPPVRNLLRVALFQLRYMEDIPARAVVNSACDLGKVVGHKGIPGFINGVLRGYLRKTGEPRESGDQDTNKESPQDEEQSLSKRYSLPAWLIRRWLAARGKEETMALLTWSQSIPPLTVRTCTSGVTVEALEKLMTDQGIKVRRGALVPDCLIIEDRGRHKGPVDKLPGYKEGLFIVQDEQAAFASQAVAPLPGDTVVDLCAAPGGKAIHLAELMGGKGRVIAVDVHEKRLNLLKETRQRVGLTNVETVAADGTTFEPGTRVDRILIDAPCTGTGVINRRADLRFQKDEPDIGALIDLQRKLLDHAAAILRDGGILVYSTCSLEQEENEDNMRWFLAAHPEFSLESLKSCAGPQFAESLEGQQLERGYYQFLPSKQSMSGFFVAKMCKQQDNRDASR
jgi:16S rRNA (cytosine967-C5)-methyltransferase